MKYIIHFHLRVFYVLPIVQRGSCTGRCAITRAVTQRYASVTYCECLTANPTTGQEVCEVVAMLREDGGPNMDFLTYLLVIEDGNALPKRRGPVSE